MIYIKSMSCFLEEVCYMKFFRKHKMLSFAVISFLVLTGANFFMIYEIVKMVQFIKI